MKLPTLYTTDSKGVVRHWTIEYNETSLRTHSGQLNGKTTISQWYIVEATNIGRANERSIAQQAEFEAKAKWQKKIDAGATTDIKACGDESKFFEPMLAKKFEDVKNLCWPVYSQPKLDGLRACVTQHAATSRSGKAWITIDHIRDCLKPVFQKYPNIVFDGELYTHLYKHDFNKICSLVKKTKPTSADLAECHEKIQYWIYDCYDKSNPDMSFRERQLLLSAIFSEFLRNKECVVQVETNIVQNKADLDFSYECYLMNGFEGQMVRDPNSPYMNKRCAFLLKRKEFQDAEYRIVEIGEGKGNKSGLAGFAVLQDESGRTFNSNIKGQFDFLRDLYNNRAKYVGTYATCTFFALTPDGIPRFPYITKLRDGVGID